MKFDRPYPYNLIKALMLDEQLNCDLKDDEIIHEVECIISSLSDRYTKNKRIAYRMQSVISFYYENGLTCKEIGVLLGISGSRASQIKQRALRIIRKSSHFEQLKSKSI